MTPQQELERYGFAVCAAASQAYNLALMFRNDLMSEEQLLRQIREVIHEAMNSELERLLTPRLEE